MDDPTLRDLLAKHQENMAGAGVISLFCSMAYSILKQFDLKRGLQAAGVSVLFATVGWFFLGEYLKLAVFFIVPVGIGAGFGAFPIVRAWVKKDDAVADKVVDQASRHLGGSE